MYYFKGKLGHDTVENELDIYIEADNSKELDQKILDAANDYSFETGVPLPIEDMFDFEEDENTNYVYTEFIESNIYDEDSFLIMWDNYMKAIGKGRI